MDTQLGVVTVAVSVLAVFLATWVLGVWSTPNRNIPHVRGWPIVGSLPGFVSGAAAFIDVHRAKLGETFSTNLFRQPVVFMTNVLDHAALYRAKKQADTHDVVNKIAASIGGISTESTNKINDPTTFNLYVKHLTGPGLASLLPGISAELEAAVAPKENGVPAVVDLHDWLSRRLFQVGLHAILGADLDADALYPFFRDLDADFPLVMAGVPPLLLSKTRRARAGLIEALKAQSARHSAAAASAEGAAAAAAAAGAGPRPGRFHPDVPPMVHARWKHFTAQGLTEHESAAVTTVLIWALHANTSAALFWTAAHVFADPRTLAAVRAEVAAAGAALSPERISATNLDEALPVLTSATWEALRLYSHIYGMRVVTEDFDLPLAPSATSPGAPSTVHLRTGDRIISYAAHHRDASTFADPHAFVADRFVTPAAGPAPTFSVHGVTLPVQGGNSHPVRAFGGGSNMCPGRFLALSEIRLLVAALARHVSIEAAAGGAIDLPHPDVSRAGLGIVPPKTPLLVRVAPFKPPAQS